MRVCAILLSVLLSLLPLQSFGEAFQDACVVTAPSGATLRTAPDPKAAKVDRIPYLAEVSRFDWSDEQTTVEGITACWFNVTWQGKEGWVFGGLVCSTPEEMAQIKAAGDKVKRVMNRLVLTADNGKTLEFIDVPVNNKENLNFRLEAILPDRGYYVVMQDGYEWCNHILVNAQDGRQQQIDAVPVFSPDGTRFVTANHDLDAHYGHNRVQIFKVIDGMGVVEWSEEPTEWGPENVAWESPARIQFTRKIFVGGGTKAVIEYDAKDAKWNMKDLPADE